MNGQILNIYLKRSTLIEGISWNVVDTVSVAGNSSFTVSSRYIYDRHQSSLSYKYISHASLHSNKLQDDLYAIQSTSQGLLILVKADSGF